MEASQVTRISRSRLWNTRSKSTYTFKYGSLRPGGASGRRLGRQDCLWHSKLILDGCSVELSTPKSSKVQRLIVKWQQVLTICFGGFGNWRSQSATTSSLPWTKDGCSKLWRKTDGSSHYNSTPTPLKKGITIMKSHPIFGRRFVCTATEALHR